MSIWVLNERVYISVTPNIFIISTRWIPKVGAGNARRSLPTHGLLTIISVDLAEFNFKLLSIAHWKMFLHVMHLTAQPRTCYEVHVMKCMLRSACYEAHVTKCMLWSACYEVHVMKCMLWSAFYEVHVMKCMLWSACYEVQVMKCKLWSACYEVHVMKCMLWSACYEVHVMKCMLWSACYDVVLWEQDPSLYFLCTFSFWMNNKFNNNIGTQL